MAELKWSEVWARRLRHHHLDGVASQAGIAQVVADVGGIHAQVMASAELSVGARIAGVNKQGVHAAIWERQELIRLSSLRGTIHLLPRFELHLWLAALSARPKTNSGWSLAGLGVPAADIDDLDRGLLAALANGPKTHKGLEAELVETVGPWVRATRFDAFGTTMAAWRLSLGTAMAQGRICYGPGQGSAVTVMLLKPTLATTDLSGERALAWAARKYLSAYGPATIDDFAAWFGAKGPVAQRAFDALGDEIEPVSVDGWRVQHLVGTTYPSSLKASVVLLPRFDVFTVGCRPRNQLVPHDLIARFGDRTPKLFVTSLRNHDVKTLPVLLVNGQVHGFWQLTRVGGESVVTVEAFQSLTKRQIGMLEKAAQTLGFVGQTPIALRLGEIELRPHL